MQASNMCSTAGKGKNMAQASNQYKADFSKDNYARIEFVIPKKAKPILQSMAKAAGESVSEYIQGAILQRMGVPEWPLQEDQPGTIYDQSKMTRTEIRRYIRQTLRCPTDFLDVLAKFGDIEELRNAIASGDRDNERQEMDAIWEAYKQYCENNSIDFEADNSRKIHFI